MHRFRYLVLWPLFVAALGIPTASALAAETRAYVAGHYALELDGVSAGPLRTVEGGGVSAGAVSNFRVEAGAGMAPAFYDWIAASWDGKGAGKSGAVLTVSYDSQILVRRDFSRASITETRLPALDAGSKDPAYVVVDFLPSAVVLKKGGGSAPSVARSQRAWTANSFRLEIAGLDCSRVRKVESFTVKKEPAGITFSDLVVTLSTTHAESWQGWDQGSIGAKSGDLIYLGPDLKSEIARVHFSGLVLQSLSASAPSARIPSLVATMHCERASLAWKGGASAFVNAGTGGK